ncbi:putative SOCS box and ankyrin repeat-containing protein [Homarus americanus]|uniref:Putative SOCS box and ankyrin repeat-containing protein n=1 Tax=Homarus americanus TaxID=6706 RepID=A0A8J5J7E1_HOMAM|nr:putative SOCS box and ankyrin repeat-containing protein [Homarus americanus]
MGGVLSTFFQSGSALLASGNHRTVSETTKKNIRIVFDALRANPRVTVQRLEGLLSAIPKVDILELLTQQGEDHWLPWQQKRPLLHIACERGAWNCVKYLVLERSDEINQCYDEYYPIHQAALHDLKFLDLLIQCGAETTVRTYTQQMTVLHVVFLLGKKTAEDTLETVKLLLQHGLKEHINTADSLGNTPLHALINGASPSINQQGNSALACVLRHVRDWEFRYELLDMLLHYGGNPNLVGRDGSYGANPNINISTTEPMICHSQSSVFLKKSSNQVLYYYVQLLIRKEELLIDPDQRFARLLHLYYLAMDHKELHQCLKILYTQTSLVPMKRPELYTKPRTLKQICRVIIYDSLGRRSAQNVNKLPLPGMLKDYILNFDP